MARKAKIEPEAPPERIRTPLEFLLDTVNDPTVDKRLRVQAAMAAARYKHKKMGDTGKKEDREVAAQKAKTGKFAPARAPNTH